MFSALFGAAVLSVIIALTVKHMPVWIKRMVLKTPAWLQAIILHFGYAGWIGGVTGHLMGAPLAILWYAIYVYWLKGAINCDVEAAGELHLIKDSVKGLKSWFGRVRETAQEVEVAVKTA
jgi:hypothetical protein